LKVKNLFDTRRIRVLRLADFSNKKNHPIVRRVVLAIKGGVFFALCLRSETPNIDKRGVEQFESTFCIQNTILDVGMDSRLKGKRLQKDEYVKIVFPFDYACS
jgi:hypothetical protein